MYISCGSTTITVDNLYDVCPVVTSLRGKNTLSTVDSHSVVSALTTATKMLPRNGNVAIDCDSDSLSVSAVSESLVSREDFPSTISDDEQYHILVSGKKLSPLSTLLKTDVVTDMRIKENQGVVSFVFPVTEDVFPIDSISFNVATAVENYEGEGNDFLDNDDIEVATLSVPELKEVLSPLTAVVSDALVTIDTSTENGVILTITSKGTAAKTIVLDASVCSSTINTVSLSSFMSALKNISTPQVVISIIKDEYAEDAWYSLSPSHVDDENPGEDIIVAIPLHS